MKNKIVLTAIILSLYIFLIDCGSLNRNFKLISPQNNSTVNTNMPEFTWKGIDADTFEVWVNNNKITTLTNGRKSYSSFPLSFGENNAQIVAIKNGKNIKSNKVAFNVTDETLRDLPQKAKVLRKNWRIKSEYGLGAEGETISSDDYNSKQWYESSVPTTVLSALVRKGEYPNPYVGINNMYIPDCNDEFNKEQDLLQYSHIKGENPWNRPYWYRKKFAVPEDYKGKSIYLNIDEINYKANIWLNGQKIADTSSVKGIDRPFTFDITKNAKLNKKNILAIEIFPPDHPGKPSAPPVKLLQHPGRNMGDGMVSLDYTRWDVVGWDWIPAVRDRDMGITEDVYISSSGKVKIEDLYIGADLPDTNTARVQISANLINNSDEKTSGIFKGKLYDNEKNVVTTFEKEVVLQNSKNNISLSPSNGFKQLKIENPDLWWPVNYGKQNLYTVKATFEVNGKNSDEIKENFGIRKVNSYIENGTRVFKVNGEKMFMKGGNWVNDMMMNWNASRYKKEIKYAAEANLNLLRVWGPDGAPPEAFFDAADEMGIMVWQDFLSDYWGTFEADSDYRPPREEYKKNSVALVKRIRNHPSLIMWCGGNEGPNQREEMLTQQVLPEYDSLHNRVYLKESNGDGLDGGGPYHTLRPENYYKDDYIQGFNSEIGPSGMPVENSLYHFLPELGQKWKEGKFPLYDDWGYHGACDRGENDSRKFSAYDNIVREDYGPPKNNNSEGVSNYIAKSQLVNYNAYRSAIESIYSKMWERTSGFALWKYNSAWPDIKWQIYDWYLRPNSGYYAMQSVSEPLHIQYNYDQENISVVNTDTKEYNNIEVTAKVYNFESNNDWKKDTVLSMMPNRELEIDWNIPEKYQKPYFLFLEINESDKKNLSKNVYWMDNNNDFAPIFEDLPEVKLKTSIKSMKLKNNKVEARIRLQNNTDKIAFFTRLKLLNPNTEKEIIPTHWNDNYITIQPHDEVTLEAHVYNYKLSEEPVISIDGINVVNTRIK